MKLKLLALLCGLLLPAPAWAGIDVPGQVLSCGSGLSCTGGVISTSDGSAVMSLSGVNAAVASAALPLYDSASTTHAPWHALRGSTTLSLGAATVTLTGSAVYTSGTTYSCTTADQSLSTTASTVVNTSGTAFKVQGSLSDVIFWQCVGW